MYNPYLRVILIVVAVYFAYNYHSIGNNIGFLISLFTIPLLIYGYFAYGSVNKALSQLKKDNLDEAIRIINQTKYPNLLSKKYKAYYHFVKGYICLDSRNTNFEESKTHYTKSLKFGLRTENDTVMALVNLASIEIELGNLQAARIQIDKAYTFHAKDSTKKTLEEIDADLKNLETT